MGTSYTMNVCATSFYTSKPKRLSPTEYEEQFAAALKVFTEYGSGEVLTRKPSRLTDVGKWDPSKCLLEACHMTRGLLFSVYSVSEYGDVVFEYYASQHGLLYRETPTPVFSPGKWEDVQAQMAKQLKEKEDLMKREEEAKKRAKAKLSKEELVLLGIS